jgi:type IV pilus assembly protein PilY1
MRRIHELLSCVLVLAMATVTVVPPVSAGQSDLNLFAGGGSLAPNIMIMLDSSGSMLSSPSGGGGSKKSIAIDSLTNLIETVNPLISGTTYEENARFGLFTFRGDGGLLNQAIGPNNTYSVLEAIRNHGTTSVGTPLSASILDVARYFAANEPWGTLPAWGSRSYEGAVANPFDYECRESFTIFISDGDPNKDAITSSLRAGYWTEIGDYDNDGGAGEGGSEIQSNVGVDNIQWTDDITGAMFAHDFNSNLAGRQNIVTHVIGFDTNGANLQRMADAGGGQYRTATNSAGLASVLTELTEASFDAIASYSTAVVPTSRTAFGSSFYNAYFAPDKDSAFWEGHIEAYDISPDGVILNANGTPAIDPATAEFYDPPNPHWDAGVRLRSNSSRTIYTTLSSTRVDFTNTAAVKASLGVTGADVTLFPNYPASGVTSQSLAEDAVIDYLYGEDAFDEDGDANSTELRDRVLGDIFHSTPAIVGPPTTQLSGESGYDTFLSTYLARDRVLYVGANDGMVHAFDAGSLTSGDNPLTPAVETSAVFYTAGSGDELFGYVPGLLLDDVKLVPRNIPRTYYFVDGSPVVADVWLRSGSGDYTRESDEWTTIAMTGFREGGAGYLALDVTDPAASSPLDDHGPYPKFLWEFTDGDLGQAWSDPVITRVRVEEGTSDVCGPVDGDGNCRERWVAIFGGGYERTADPNHDDFAATPADTGWTTRSKAIYMVDLATGTILAKVEYDAVTNPLMNYALPSRPAVLDLDFDGFADVVYVGDVGGQMWKWDISAKGRDDVGSDGIIDNWSYGVFFTAAPASDGTELRYKSFFYPPAATFSRNQLVLAFATGEREQLEYEGAAGYDENNRVYVLKDRSPTGTYAFTNTYTEADVTDVTNTSTDQDLTDQGYFFVADDGEKFVSEMVVFAGYLILTSFDIDTSNPDPCAGASGTSQIYAVRVDSGQGYFTAGSPPTPMDERKKYGGTGLASTPRISIAPDPEDDAMYVKTSKGLVVTIDPPPRPGSGTSVIYWKQNQ